MAMNHRPQSKDVFPPFQFFSECMKICNIRTYSLHLLDIFLVIMNSNLLFVDQYKDVCFQGFKLAGIVMVTPLLVLDPCALDLLLV